MTEAQHVRSPTLLGRALDWLLRSRKTGRITVAQPPNVPILVWFAASLPRWLLNPTGATGTFLAAVAAIALVVWAGDELLRGVNPFRRMLGAAVLASLAVSLAH